MDVIHGVKSGNMALDTALVRLRSMFLPQAALSPLPVFSVPAKMDEAVDLALSEEMPVLSPNSISSISMSLVWIGWKWEDVDA